MRCFHLYKGKLTQHTADNIRVESTTKHLYHLLDLDERRAAELRCTERIIKLVTKLLLWLGLVELLHDESLNPQTLLHHLK